jgi:5-methylcytosine-specific restriction endonuclease McrA
MSNMMAQPVLVLNSSYEPIRIAEGRDALKLIVKGKARAEEELDIKVYAGILMPSVVRLSLFRRVPRIRVQPHRKNIYLRDGYRCQYCGVRFKAQALTLDHIIPKAQGGLDTWENLVACCSSCNKKKGAQTPEQAGMPLLQNPWPSSIHTSRHLMRLMGQDDPKWSRYLYCN